MNPSFIFEDIVDFEFDEDGITHWLNNVCKEEGKSLGVLTVVFCSDNYLLKVNKKYLQHDYYTDIITFDYSEGKTISGDLLVSTERVFENALSLGVEFKHELKRVLVHGVLHLIGYDDKTEALKSEMRNKEDYYLGFT